jgi:ATP-dependent Lon protease
MEIIDISGYLLEEKVEIATRHIIPRILKEHNFTAEDISFSRDCIVKIIECYTSESGVRQLEKKISTILRKIVLKKMSGEEYTTELKPEHLRDLLGVEIYSKDRYEGNNFAGVVTGLAWTAVGGEILFIESSLAKAKGEKLTLTGNLGDVMKESAVIALQYVKSHATQLGIDSELFDKYSLHIHVPEGAIPKDGPSAGITMATSIISTFTQKKVRNRVAMTGEITLRGKVLPVGGIKEKILAAKRAGITDIIISKENRKDVEDISEKYISDLNFHYVSTVMEVVKIAITDEIVPDAISL